MLQFRLSHVALFVLLLLVLYLSGTINNPFSLLLIVLALLTALATMHARGATRILGLVSLGGWLLMAAICAHAFRA